mgnify:FL=1
MNDAVRQLIGRYRPVSLDDHLRALREVLQELALLGLWRSRFFEHAAFYGGTALRVLHGLNRFSEDLDFSLLIPRSDFQIGRFTTALETEIRVFGFDVTVQAKSRTRAGAIQSAFLKGDTLGQLVSIDTPASLTRAVPRGQTIKIRIEIDTNPPPAFETEVLYLLAPIPFPVRVYALPDLFAGKMHALLCRQWKARVKGRDWYDLVWFCGHYPDLHLAHLEARLAQSGHWPQGQPLTAEDLRRMLDDTIERVNLEQARAEVEPFVADPAALRAWSRPFFKDLGRRIIPV